MSLLKVKGLQAGYGTSKVLFDISLNFNGGELVTLLGRNGMGKTTTINSLMGIVKPTAGQIEFNGEVINLWPSYRIAQSGLALVPEGRQIFPNLTARENLIATAVQRPGNGDQWTLNRVLELFPSLGARLNSMGNLLSGGEQQMLAIGRALMTNPRALLLDDATEGLAPQVRQQIWQTLKLLKAEGLAVLVVDKNVGDLLEFADHHYVVEKGCVVWHGDSQEWTRANDMRARYLGI